MPQFVETEVKIIGPLTLKQFLWVAAGAVLLFLFFNTLRGIWFFVAAIPTVVIACAMAFLKINDLTLVEYVSSFFSFLSSPKRYVFKKATEKTYLNNG
ncbi:MAG TPA: PrgI family protein [Candidatus Paceibacterota bacterium]